MNERSIRELKQYYAEKNERTDRSNVSSVRKVFSSITFHLHLGVSRQLFQVTKITSKDLPFYSKPLPPRLDLRLQTSAENASFNRLVMANICTSPLYKFRSVPLGIVWDSAGLRSTHGENVTFITSLSRIVPLVHVVSSVRYGPRILVLTGLQFRSLFTW